MDDPFQVPTAYKRSKKANAKTINKKESWLPFTKVEVEKLHSTTLAKGDNELGNLIVIAAYSGARIEEICSMKKDFIDTDEQTFTIVDAKTQAGNRVVPIHPNIKELVSELLTKSNNDYMFGELTENMYGNRSNAIGKRFGRIKKELGFDKRHVFHSIRKTFTTELERAGITENLAADILGHEKPRITYGIYSGGSDLNQKRKAIQKIKFKF
jgi:integrase